MLGSLSPSPKALALVARQSNSRNKQRNSQFCEHCQKPYHIKATCWKLHGKLAEWVPRHLCGFDGKDLHIVTKTSTEPTPTSPFSQARLDHLSKPFSDSSTSLMAHSTAISSLTSQPPKGDPWIIDSDASNHMTGARSLFRDYFPYQGDRRVKLANGSFTCVAGHGIVWLKDFFFCLFSVLYVPSLSCNLLSISKVTADLRCLVKFSHCYCIF